MHTERNERERGEDGDESPIGSHREKWREKGGYVRTNVTHRHTNRDLALQQAYLARMRTLRHDELGDEINVPFARLAEGRGRRALLFKVFPEVLHIQRRASASVVRVAI